MVEVAAAVEVAIGELEWLSKAHPHPRHHHHTHESLPPVPCRKQTFNSKSMNQINATSTADPQDVGSLDFNCNSISTDVFQDFDFDSFLSDDGTDNFNFGPTTFLHDDVGYYPPAPAAPLGQTDYHMASAFNSAQQATLCLCR